MNDMERGTLERHVGKAVLECLDRLEPDALRAEVDSDAANTLQRICQAVNDETMDDFSCVDAIVTILSDAGFQVRRHDF